MSSSYSPFKEVTTANPGSSTRYGSDDLLDIMKIFNAKVALNRRPDIANPWRFSNAVEFRAVTSPTAPTDLNVSLLYNDATDNKIKIKKSGGAVISIEDLGTGAWDKNTAETFTNKTIGIENNFLKHSTTNFVGDILTYDGTRYNRKAKGAANQYLAVNAAGTDLEWQTPTTGGGGGGSGEPNQAANIGTAGIGIFALKQGIELQFKKIFSPTGTIFITDNIANERVDLDLGPGIVTINQVNTYGDFNQTFRSGKLRITNPANTFAYSIVGSPLATASWNLTLPLITAHDTFAVVNTAQTLVNKTLTSAEINTDQNTIKHSATNSIGELMVNNGTKFERRAKGAAGTYLRMNPGGTDLEWGALPSFTGGVKLPADGSIAPTTGRWGAFFGGAGNGFGMLGFFANGVNSVHGTTLTATESVTDIQTGATASDFAEYKTGCGFRRDSNAVFKFKWRMTHSSGFRVKLGLSSATSLPVGAASGAGGGYGTPGIRYDVVQSSADHMEMSGYSRLAVRFNSGAPGLGQAVTEVVVRFRKYGSPSGSATVGIRKASDGTLVSLGTFTPSSFGSGEQVATITPSPASTYLLVVNDRISVEFPDNASDGIELDEDDAGPPSGFTSQGWNGSAWTDTTEAIALRITTATYTAPTGGGPAPGDTPLANSASGIMIHGSTDVHSNYMIGRNSGTTAQATVDSGKPLANTSTHTGEININSTNIIVTLDGTAFTYTANIPATSTAMTFFLHVEASTAAVRGLGIAYAQVVMA